MTVRSIQRRGITACAVAAAGVLLLAGCGSDDKDDKPSASGSTPGTQAPGTAPGTAPAAAPGADEALKALLPADLKSSGKLVIGTDMSYAPNEFLDKDGKTPIGMDIDLGKAIAAKLGLTADFQNSKFDAIIPGIESKKFTIAMSSLTDSKEREEKVDMVTYFKAGTSLAVKKGNPDKIDPADLCGKKVAVQTGTVQVDEINDKRNPDCKSKGKSEIPDGGSKFDLQTDVTGALMANRVQVMMADTPVVDYAAKVTNGQLEKIGDTYDTAPYGIAVGKGNGDLAKAVQGAVQALMTDGTYKQILEKWAIQAGAIDKSVVNGAES